MKPMNPRKPRIIVLLGPTATGKSALAMELAARFNGEIINADSMQVYRFMDIGTAKPDKAARMAVRHHLIDIADPGEQYSAGRFYRDAAKAIEEIGSRGNLPFVVGGTGLYIRALTEGLFNGPAKDAAIRDELMEEARVYGKDRLHEELARVDPESARSIHPNNLRRVIRALEVFRLERRPISELQKEGTLRPLAYDTLKIGLKKERPCLYADIDRRVEEMIQDGLVEESEMLLKKGYDESTAAMGGLGYKECLKYLHGAGNLTLPEAIELIKRDTRHYAKRQMTWFKKDNDIKWFNPDDKQDIIAALEKFLD